MDQHKVASIPVVLFAKAFWQQAVNFEFLVEQGIVSAVDPTLFKTAKTADDAIKVLEQF